MNKTKEAIKYGIETLKVSPETMFNLFESSKDYEGNEYPKWLASKIIKIAEEDGLGFSQLLVKKFDIIYSLIEENASKLELSGAILDGMLSKSDGVVAVFGSKLLKQVSNYGHSCIDLTDCDFETGIDLDSTYNSQFLDRLGNSDNEGYVTVVETLRNSNTPLSVLVDLSEYMEVPNKKSDLYLDYLSTSKTCKSKAVLLLHRLKMLGTVCNDCPLTISFVCNSSFLYDPDNSVLMSDLSYLFNIHGLYFNSSNDVYKGSFSSYKYAVVTMESTNEPQLGTPITLCSGSVTDECVRYSDDFEVFTRSSDKMSTHLQPKVLEGVLGYLDLTGVYPVLRSGYGDEYIPITDDNLLDIIAYYGVSVALEGYGLSSSIGQLVSGHELYPMLSQNCIPLFLFDVNSKFNDGGVSRVNGEIVRKPNMFNVLSSCVVESLLGNVVHFSFEAKRLISICMQLIETSTVGNGNFSLVLDSASESELKEYFSSLNSLKDFVRSIYRKME